MLLKTQSSQQYIDINSSSAFRDMTSALHMHMSGGLAKGCKSIVFVCIGTDRSTGDSLGPMVGYKINGLKRRNVYTYGSLDDPVHAKNIDEVMQKINTAHIRPFVVAIDACLGKMDHVGYVTIGEGSIKPGSGVNKDLMPVGDMFITGIVNFGGFMDFLVLQNTRLSIVMKMADLIAMSIRYVLWKLNSDPETASGLYAADA